MALQRRAATPAAPVTVPPIVNEVLSSPGQPLDSAARAQWEPRFRHNFSNVRVHTDGRAAESAQAVNALAFTVGPNIVFGPGRYHPGTAGGQQLLAHELAHVVQQGGGGPAAHWGIGRSSAGADSDALAIGASDSPAERQADSAAAAALQGGSVASLSSQPPEIARQPAPPAAPAAPAPTPDQQTMQSADVRRTGMLLFAQSKLADLATAVRGGTGNSPAVAPTAAAVTHWLNVAQGDAAFLSTVEKAQAIISKSLGIKTRVLRSPEGSTDCKQHPYAVSNVGIPVLNIRCCNAFFEAGQECQADVIAHEYFHLAGLHHGEAPGRSTTRAAMNTAQALNSADNMAQMVSEISRGTSDACPAGR
jgi:hypothetical protein